MNPRVFMIGWEFPPHNSGGLGTACKGLTRALSGEKVTQTFVLPKKLPINVDFAKIVFPDNPYFSQLQVNLDLKPYGEIEKNYGWYLNKNKRSKYRFNTRMVNEAYEYADVVGALAASNDHDLIHGHDWMTYPAAIAAKKVSGKPLVLHVHATEFDRTLHGNTNPEISQIEHDSLSACDRVIAVSDYTRNLVVERYNIDKSKIDVVHNGIDADEIEEFNISDNELHSLAKGKKIVVFVGRLTGQKGPDYFVKVAQQVVAEVPDTLFVIAGDGDMYNQIVMQSAQSNLTGKLLFSGFVRNKERAFLYKRADLFIMPSVSEPFGIVALEAAMAKNPVIISKQSGVSEVLKNAISYDYWNTNEIALKSIEILKNDGLRAEMAAKTAAEVCGINWGVAAKKCLSVYKSI